MLNKVMLIGNIGIDPEKRSNFYTFSLATNVFTRDKETKEKKILTEWHNICCFNKHICKLIEEGKIKKGSKVYLEGTLQTNKFTDKNGVEKKVTQIVIGDFNSTLIMLGESATTVFAGSKEEVKNIINNMDDDIPW